MKYFKRLLACLMVVALLACVPTAVSADVTDVPLFTDEVKHSITADDADIGNGLAFLFTLSVDGAEKDEAHYYVEGSATVTLSGVTYKVAAMGAVVTNDTAVGKVPSLLVRENVQDNRTVVDVAAKRLCTVTETTCSFAVRINKLMAHIPSTMRQLRLKNGKNFLPTLV